MNNYVITISRQVGSGGSVLGRKIAEHFNFKYIDKEILIKVAEELNVSEKELEWMDEKRPLVGNSLFQSNVYTLPYLSDAWNVPTGKRIFDLQTRIIRQAVEEAPCVVIGRCGSFIFKDYEKHASIFLHADEEKRLERLKKTLDFTHEKSIKMIERADKDRARYYNTYTGKKWLNLTDYDLCIDTGRMGDEEVEKVIIDYVCTRFPELR